MIFNSFDFLIFFPCVVAAYFLLSQRFRWILLLCASYYFYMCWKPEYVVLIMVSTLVDYWAALKMGAKRKKNHRKPYLYLSIFSNLGLLFAFKYANFFSSNLSKFFPAVTFPYSDFLLPVGISFYTFQTLSYTIDVYQEKQKPERHLGIFAVYVTFFPQLVAGPIERAKNLLPQFRQKAHFDPAQASDGLKLMLWGLFKKIVIADQLGVFVNLVYAQPQEATSVSLILASYFFAFQIYCDFSGYSDIAIGTAQVLGYRLNPNFNRPYFSQSIGEFWRRWHISLSGWFRDYVYIPLGGNRVTRPRLYVNLFIVFAVSGLWHGANWTFIIWGCFHGFYLILSHITQKQRKKISERLKFEAYPRLLKIMRQLMTFHLVVFAWIFFRADSLSDALLIITKIVHINPLDILLNMHNMGSGQKVLGLPLPAGQVALCLTGILVLVSLQAIQERCHLSLHISLLPRWQRWTIYYAIVFCILFLGKFNHTPFVYFQF